MDDLTFRWKGNESTNSYIEQKPHVYAFTYDDLSGGMPLHTPSVCVQLVSVDDNGIGKYIVHVCVCDPALQDAEITKPVEGEIGVYEYKSGDCINSKCVRSELYKFAILLGEQVYTAIKQAANTNIDARNVEFLTPSPYMDNFPFCDCTVSFDSDIMNIIETTNKSELEKML